MRCVFCRCDLDSVSWAFDGVRDQPVPVCRACCERKAAERRLKAAHFPTHKTLAGFDFTARPSVNKLLVSELARCEYIDRRENVLFVGNPGTG
jgi:DNA replication protein DnaC